MKKLILLLSALLVLSTLAPSPVLAARPSIECRLQSLMIFFVRNAFPVPGVCITASDILPIGGGGVWGGRLGGDADDYGNGRGDTVIGGDSKGSVRLLGNIVVPGSEPSPLDRGMRRTMN
jgi:hypothetical protein